MAHQKKDLAIGAAVGVVLVVTSEVVRHLFGNQRSVAHMAFGLWVVPFAAVMWSVGRSQSRRKAVESAEPTEPAETGRPHA
ncbi:hypothetical protein [Nesterenkonia sp. CF4.4]|uniref:hypothetical protein n=1 Tax=Nesterenkonia sp. CF4.4 TaxID=3373079 RepID=UPI003EE7AA67